MVGIEDSSDGPKRLLSREIFVQPDTPQVPWRTDARFQDHIGKVTDSVGAELALLKQLACKHGFGGEDLFGDSISLGMNRRIGKRLQYLYNTNYPAAQLFVQTAYEVYVNLNTIFGEQLKEYGLDATEITSVNFDGDQLQ